MMKFENLIHITDVEFERFTGVSRADFAAMLKCLRHAEQCKKKSGRPHSLSLENQLLLTLNYLGHARTQLQLAADYHLAESNVNRTISKVEQALAEMSQVCLPARMQAKSQAHALSPTDPSLAGSV